MATPSNTNRDGTFSVGELGPVLRRWWWLMLPPMALVVTAVVLLTSRATPTYRAEAEVVIRTKESANLFPLSEATTLLRSPSAEEGFLASTNYVAAAELRANPLDRVVVDVGNVNSRVEPSFISFTAKGNEPESVAATANAWARTYIEMRHERDIAELSQTVGTLTTTLTALQEERAEVLEALAPIDRLLSTTNDATAVAQLTTQRLALLQSLDPQLSPIDAQLDAINAELGGLRLIQNFLTDDTVSARMNRIPAVPNAPVSPSLPRNIAFGIFAALLLGATAVLIAESMDDRVRGTDQLSDETGLSYLTTVPMNKNDDGSAILTDHGPIAESFQRLASSIDFARVSSGRKQVLMFTSARASESKTTTVARLGAVFARQGKKTIVVGADLRRPTLSGRFGVDEGPGLAEYLAGLYSIEDSVVPVPDATDLSILRSGAMRADRSPAELLRSPRMAELVATLRQSYDVVLIDCPPVLPVVDALEIAKLSDGIILNTFASRTRLAHVRHALELIRRAANVPVLGYVLTGVNERGNSYTNSYYGTSRARLVPSTAAPVSQSASELDLDLVGANSGPAMLPEWEGPVQRRSNG